MTWLTIISMAAITYINRYMFFAQAIRYQPSASLRRFLNYSSYAILTAIWTPIVFSLDPQTGLDHAGNDYLIAALVAAILAFYRVKSILVVILSTVVFFGLRFLLTSMF